MHSSVENNARHYYRLHLDPPLCSDMTIVRVNGKTLETGAASVLIVDLGAGGLRFQTNLQLPVSPNVVLEFETIILQQTIKMFGYVVRSISMSEDLTEYGVQFTMDEDKIARLSQLINTLAIRKRQNRTMTGSRFLTENRDEFLSCADPS